MTVDNWKWVAEKLGIPTLFVVVLCYAIYATGSWTASHVFDPMVSRHLEFLSTEQDSMRTIAESASKQAESMVRQASQMEEHTRLLQEISEATESTKVINKQIRDDQRKFPAVSEKMP